MSRVVTVQSHKQQVQRKGWGRLPNHETTLRITNSSSSGCSNGGERQPSPTASSSDARSKQKKQKRPLGKTKWKPVSPDSLGMYWGLNAGRWHALDNFCSDSPDCQPPLEAPKPTSPTLYRALEALCDLADDYEAALDSKRSYGGRHLRQKKKWAHQKPRLALKGRHALDLCGAGGLWLSARVHASIAERLKERLEAAKCQHLPRRTLKDSNSSPVPSDSMAPRVKPRTPKEPVVRQNSAPAMAAHQLVDANVPGDMDEALASLMITLQHRDITPEDYDLLLRLDESLAAPTVAEEALAELPVRPAEAGGELCPVCMEEVVLGAPVKFLPCQHSFHEACIDRWLAFSSRNCPLDGLPVDKPS